MLLFRNKNNMIPSNYLANLIRKKITNSHKDVEKCVYELITNLRKKIYKMGNISLSIIVKNPTDMHNEAFNMLDNIEKIDIIEELIYDYIYYGRHITNNEVIKMYIWTNTIKKIHTSINPNWINEYTYNNIVTMFTDIINHIKYTKLVKPMLENHLNNDEINIITAYIC